MAIGMQTENIRDTFNNLWGLIDDILFTLQDKAIEVFVIFLFVLNLLS